MYQHFFFGGGTVLPLWFSREANRWSISERRKFILWGVGVRNPSFFNNAPFDLRYNRKLSIFWETVCRNRLYGYLTSTIFNCIQSYFGVCAPTIRKEDFEKLKKYQDPRKEYKVLSRDTTKKSKMDSRYHIFKCLI